VQDFALLPEGAQIFRLKVAEGSPLVDRSISESRQRELIPDSMQILAVSRDGKQTIPEGETVIQEGDILTVFSLEQVSDKLIEKLTG